MYAFNIANIDISILLQLGTSFNSFDYDSYHWSLTGENTYMAERMKAECVHTVFLRNEGLL